MSIIIDLHNHLSGATSTKILWELVCESGFKIKSKTYKEFNASLMLGRNTHDLAGYLDILHIVDRMQSSPAAIEKSVYDAFVNAAVKGTDVMELRFNPTKRSLDGQIDLDKIIVSARAGYERARENFGIRGGLILCMGRDCTLKANQAILTKAFKFAGKGIIGIDVAGAYSWPWPDSDFYEEAFKIADGNGDLVTTIHAGEENHPFVYDELNWVLTKLKPKRIGHGIQIMNTDLAPLAKDVHFEVCISSNIATGAVKSHAEMATALKHFRNNGLAYSLGTDASELLSTSVTMEQSLHSYILSNNP